MTTPPNRFVGPVLALLLALSLTSFGVEDVSIRKSLEIAGLAANAEVRKELAAPPEGWPEETRLVQQAHSILEQPDNGSILTALIALHKEAAKSGISVVTLESAPIIRCRRKKSNCRLDEKFYAYIVARQRIILNYALYKPA
jgi:hypothetical protein